MIEYATFLELMTSINKLYISNNSPIQKHTTYQYNEQVEQILKYINQNITDDITIEYLANHFFLSKSYICRIFKSATGTTINKYLSARRISIAKSMLSDGLNVNDVCEKCGFND